MHFLRSTYIQLRLFQLAGILEERRKVVAHIHSHIPIVEVVVQHRHFDGYRSVQVFGCKERDFRQPFRTFALRQLLVHLNVRFRLFQGDVAPHGKFLPVAFGQCLHLSFQQRGIGHHKCLFRQTQGGHQPVVHDFTCVSHPCQLQFQALLLKLVTRDVIPQDSPLPTPCLHVCNHLPGKLKVLFQYLRLIVQLIQVKIISEKLEAHILPVLLPAQFRLPLSKRSQFDAAVDCTSGIDHLLHFE